MADKILNGKPTLHTCEAVGLGKEKTVDADMTNPAFAAEESPPPYENHSNMQHCHRNSETTYI